MHQASSSPTEPSGFSPEGTVSPEDGTVSPARAAEATELGVAEAGAVAEAADTLALVRTVVEPIVVAHGIDLDGVAWATEHGARTLRVTIERRNTDGRPQDPMGGFGVSLDDCADVSRDLSAALDERETIPHAYNLEVSSPGLDRPLRVVGDFARFVGWLAKVKLEKAAPDGQKLLRGRILSVDGREIELEVDKKHVRVAHDDVVSANLVFEMPTRSKTKKAKPKKADHKKKRSD